jgi:predicted  nucleic acid-binding Zn-ribbon protein
MTSNILVNPIANAANPDEELVLALAAHLEPVLENWRMGVDLRDEVQELEALLPSLNSQAETLDQEIQAIVQKIQAASKDYKSPPLLMLISGVVIGSAIAFFQPWFGLILASGLIGGGLYLLKKLKTKLQAQKTGFEPQLAEVEEKIKNVLQEINNSKSEIESRGNSFPQITQVKAAFALGHKTLLEHSTLIDESGVFDSIQLHTIDLSETQSDWDVVASKLQALQEVPVLLSTKTNSKSDDPVDTLFGEEDEIQELVYEFTNSLSQVKDLSLTIPLLSNKSELVNKFVSGSFSDMKYKDGDVKEIRTLNKDSESIEAFIKQVNETKNFGIQVLAELKETFDNLERVCLSYSTARSNSINNVHAKLFDVLNKASWCSKRFYCPRSIQAPVFLQDILSVQPKHAHNLNFDQMVFNLGQDKVIAARMKDKPELVDKFFVNYNAVQEFRGEIEFDDLGDPVDSGDRPAYVNDAFQEALARFRANLSVLMTGSPNPILNFSLQSELFFDPEVDEWRSGTVPYVYSTSEVLQYGQVLKVTSDLMIPLWEHLWTEKSDFRKSELFRTNESLIRMSEKESEKLIDIANQFRSDMRSVRENINLLEADLKSKYDEILAFREGMQVLGLLSERQEQFLTDDKLKSLTLGDHSIVAEGEQHETFLGMEPRNQAERRGSADDPIDLIRSPDILIPYKNNAAKRLSAY